MALQRPLSLIDDRKLELVNNSRHLVELCPLIGLKITDFEQKVLPNSNLGYTNSKSSLRKNAKQRPDFVAIRKLSSLDFLPLLICRVTHIIRRVTHIIGTPLKYKCLYNL